MYRGCNFFTVCCVWSECDTFTVTSEAAVVTSKEKSRSDREKGVQHKRRASHETATTTTTTSLLQIQWLFLKWRLPYCDSYKEQNQHSLFAPVRILFLQMIPCIMTCCTAVTRYDWFYIGIRKTKAPLLTLYSHPNTLPALLCMSRGNNKTTPRNFNMHSDHISIKALVGLH